eukprot:6198315-Pleurochrysis_carterae.AAC.1
MLARGSRWAHDDLHEGGAERRDEVSQVEHRAERVVALRARAAAQSSRSARKRSEYERVNTEGKHNKKRLKGPSTPPADGVERVPTSTALPYSRLWHSHGETSQLMKCIT